MEKLLDGLQWYIVFLFSTTLHEAAHAFAAMRLGDMTAYNGGQVTLNPVPHIKREPFGTVIVPIASFIMSGWMIGWASAPYNREWAWNYPKRSALMALAGPAANALLVIIAAVIIRLGFMSGYFIAPDKISFLHVTLAAEPGIAALAANMVSLMFSLNLLLLAFNLLPVPPLDGSSAVQLAMSEDGARRYLTYLQSNPYLSFAGLFFAWQIFGMVFRPIHVAAINLLYPDIGYY